MHPALGWTRVCEGQMSEQVLIEEDIHGEWWWLAALIEVLTRPPLDLSPEALGRVGRGIVKTWLPNGVSLRIMFGSGVKGTVELQGAEAMTSMRITAEFTFQNLVYWNKITDQLKAAAGSAHRYKRSTIGPTIDQALDEYYRLRASGSKITLKEVAAQIDVSYAYLRKRKIAYDRKKDKL